MKTSKWVVKRGTGKSVDTLFELYEQLYEKRFRRKLKGAVFKNSVKDNLDHLLQRTSYEEASQAVTAILSSPRLRWVTGRPDTFLANRNTYESYVAPVVAEKNPGEQAEWKGDRFGESGAVSAKDFFGR